MAGFAGPSLRLGQEFLFFSSDKNSFPLISFLCKWSILSSQTPPSPTSLPVGTSQWERTSEFAHYILSNSFSHHCISLFSHLPVAIAPSKPHASQNTLPATNSSPSLPFSQELSSRPASGPRELTAPPAAGRGSLFSWAGFVWSLKPFAC